MQTHVVLVVPCLVDSDKVEPVEGITLVRTRPSLTFDGFEVRIFLLRFIFEPRGVSEKYLSLVELLNEPGVE